MPEVIEQVAIRLSEEVLPPHDPLHGTPHPLVRRLVTIELSGGSARWEQTDYGHPGRFNAWESREIATVLQPKFRRLQAVVEAVGALVG